MNVRTALAAFFIASQPLATLSATPPSSAAAVLARVRTAMLARPLSSIRSVRTTGSAVALGLHGHSVEWDDVGNERFVQSVTGANILSGKSGYDGHVSWSQDRSGIVRIDGGRSTQLQNVDDAYMQALAYLRPNAGGATASFLGERHEGNVAYDVVEITPPGGSPMDLWVDRSTNLISKMGAQIGIDSQTIAYSDYRRVSGVEVPFHVTTLDSNGNGSTFDATACAINAPGLATALRIPRSSPHDFSIARGSSTTVPMNVINNHIYVRVMLDGKGPYTFVFDTGGTYIVTPEVAAALHASNTGGMQVGGVGSHTEGASFTRVASLQIGGATIRDQDFLVLPIAQGFGVAEGMKIDGMFGPGVPDRFLTIIDYAHGTLTLALQGSVKPRGTAIPFFFDGTIPKVPVAIEGTHVNADLDTGNRGELFLTTPFVASHPAIAALASTADGVAGFGVGGPSFGRLGRISNVRIGPYALHGVIADFATQHTGATADPFTPANVGGGIWNRFTLTLDYAHQRIYIAPNARYGSAFSYDRSGLFLIDNNGSTTVLAARAGTPGASAGLQRGDVILTVDGKPASAYTLAELRVLLSGAPGTQVRLHIRSGASERDVTLTLANYV